MRLDDPAVTDMLHRAMVARIATLSSHGRPNVNPLYFVHHRSQIWLGTADWTLAARNVRFDPRVSLLFNLEQGSFAGGWTDQRVLRINGRAHVRTDSAIIRPYNLRVAIKYLLPPGAILNRLAHFRQAMLHSNYRAQNAAKGVPCVIEVTPDTAELIAMG
jgi:hypothetical protein